MTYSEAQEKFIGKYFRYSHLYKAENFLELDLKVADMPSHRLKFSTDYYKDMLEKSDPLPPIFIMCGYKLRCGRIEPFHFGNIIIDGNHRLGACREINVKTLPVIMSESQYHLFEWRKYHDKIIN